MPSRTSIVLIEQRQFRYITHGFVLQQPSCFYPGLVISVIYIIGFGELSCHFIIYDGTAARSGHYFIRYPLFTHLSK